MVFRSLKPILEGMGSDKIRRVVEKACSIFKQSLGTHPANRAQMKTFFMSTFDYLSSQLEEKYAISRLARELDLEWQSIAAELLLD
jgi:hypothetical protein